MTTFEKEQLAQLLTGPKQKLIFSAAEDDVTLRIAAHHAPEKIIAAEDRLQRLTDINDAMDKIAFGVAAHADPKNILAEEKKLDELLEQEHAYMSARKPKPALKV
jgi:hypothetical protein